MDVDGWESLARGGRDEQDRRTLPGKLAKGTVHAATSRAYQEVCVGLEREIA